MPILCNESQPRKRKNKIKIINQPVGIEFFGKQITLLCALIFWYLLNHVYVNLIFENRIKTRECHCINISINNLFELLYQLKDSKN